MAEPVRLDDGAVEDQLRRLDDVLTRLEQVPGPTAEAAREAVRALTEVYGEALARVLDRAGAAVTARCLDDDLLRHLLVLHGLHPGSVEQRVEDAVRRVRPVLESQGGTADLVRVSGDVAHVEVRGGGCGAHGAGDAVRAVTEAILAMAPEITTVEALPGRAEQAVIPVEALLRRPVTAADGR